MAINGPCPYPHHLWHMNRLDVLLLYEPSGAEPISHRPEDVSKRCRSPKTWNHDIEDDGARRLSTTTSKKHTSMRARIRRDETVNEIYNGWVIADFSAPTRCKHCAWATARQPGPGHATHSCLLFIIIIFNLMRINESTITPRCENNY